jgi:Flp pilus assembly protein TadB
MVDKKSTLQGIAGAFVSYFKWMSDNITWFLLGILLVNVIAFLLIPGGIIFAILNAVILILLALRLYRDRHYQDPDE